MQSLQFPLPGCTKGQHENHLVWGSGVRSSSTLLCILIWLVIIWNNFVSLKEVWKMYYLWIRRERGHSARIWCWYFDTLLILWYSVYTLIFCRYFGTWCWYFSGCRYTGLVSISGNHLIPDARHCHHFEVRYVRPGNNIFFIKIIQMVCCMHNTFHFMRNSTLSVMKDLSKFSSTTWVITIPICTWKNILILSHEMIEATNL